MTPNQKHVEIILNEILKRSDSYDPQTIRTQILKRQISVHIDEALTALSLLQEECDKEKADLNEQIEWYKESIDHYNADEKEYEATISSLRAELEEAKKQADKEYKGYKFGKDENY